MRARSWALRDGFGDVLRGLQIREEVMDYDAELNKQSDGSYSIDKAEDLTERLKSEAKKAGTNKLSGLNGKYGKGEIEPDTEPSKEEPPLVDQNDPIDVFRNEWIKLKGPGFSTYFYKNRKCFEEASPELQAEAKAKWEKLYPDSPWPIEKEKPVPREKEEPEQEKGPNPYGYLQDSKEYQDMIAAREALGDEIYNKALEQLGIENPVTSEDCAKIAKRMSTIADLQAAGGKF
jgi:hypothetical protein